MRLFSQPTDLFAICNEEELFISELDTLHSMGIDYVSIGKIFPKGGIYSFFSHPKWAEFYKEHRLFLQDPCFHSLYKTVNILASWKYFSEDSPVMKTRRAMCEISDGLSLYDRDPHSQLIIGIASSDKKVIPQVLDSPTQLKALFHLKKEISKKLSHPLFSKQSVDFHRKFHISYH